MTEIVKIVNGKRIPLTAEELIEHNAKLPSAEEIAERKLKILRMERNSLLAQTDWWVAPDRTPTDEQLVYRQALRDITNTYSSIDEVIWPEKPE